MNFKEERDLCYQWPESSHFTAILASQRQELFYILLHGQLLVFTKEGNNIRSEFNEGKSGFPKYPTSFCVDEVGNFIVTNFATGSIRFFSPEGDLFYKIGEDTVGSDVVVGATDMVAYNGKVIVLCHKRYHYGQIRVY